MAKPYSNAAARDDAPAGLYPIRTVSTLTGVNSVTLRAWERRYGLVEPVRTDSGHRLYTRDDIERVHRIVALLEKGVPVSQVRQALAERAPARVSAESDAGPWPRYRERMIGAIIRFDESALEDTYNEALSLHPVDMVTRRLLLPLLQALGDRWQSAEGSIAEEHFFGVYLRNKLGARFHHRRRNQTGPKLLGACLPGELHEVGLLLFALSANERDYRQVLLGADMPLEELAAAAQRAQVDAIVLSGSLDPAPETLATALPALVAAAGVPVAIGGLTSVNHRDAIVAAGAVPLGIDIEQGLKHLDELLSRR